MRTNHHAVIPEKLVFIDLETTGANIANDRVIEIGLVIIDAQGVREWQALVNPGMNLSPFITDLTGITQEMVDGAPSFDQVATTLLSKMQDGLFIAHNARFDYSFLKGEYKRLDVSFKMPCLCTVKLSRRLFPEYHQHSLDALIKRHAILVENRHRALDDAKILWELWQTWHQMLAKESIHATALAIVGLPNLPPQLDISMIDELPESPGAYALLDAKKNALQIKCSANVRQQVISTLAKTNSTIAQHVADVRFTETAGQLGAKLYERIYSLKYQPKEPFWENLCSWQLLKHADGDFRPSLVMASETDFATTDELYGFYKDKRQAIQTLRKLAQIHHLCLAQLGLEAVKQGEACSSHKLKSCRGLCVGRESLSVHSARLMAALAKQRIRSWPYTTPVAIVERDQYAMLEDFYIIDRWRYLGTARSEMALNDIFEHQDNEKPFDPEIYKIINKALLAGKNRIIPLNGAF